MAHDWRDKTNRNEAGRGLNIENPPNTVTWDLNNLPVPVPARSETNIHVDYIPYPASGGVPWDFNNLPIPIRRVSREVDDLPNPMGAFGARNYNYPPVNNTMGVPRHVVFVPNPAVDMAFGARHYNNPPINTHVGGASHFFYLPNPIGAFGARNYNNPVNNGAEGGGNIIDLPIPMGACCARKYEHPPLYNEARGLKKVIDLPIPLSARNHDNLPVNTGVRGHRKDIYVPTPMSAFGSRNYGSPPANHGVGRKRNVKNSPNPVGTGAVRKLNVQAGGVHSFENVLNPVLARNLNNRPNSATAEGMLLPPTDNANIQRLDIIEPMDDIVAKEGSKVILTNKVNDMPITAFQWLQNGKAVEDKLVVTSSIKDGIYKLQIDQIAKTDHGVYRFLIKGPHNYRTCHAKVFVGCAQNSPDSFGILNAGPIPRYHLNVRRHLTNQTLSTGDRLELRAEFNSKGTFYWFKNDCPIITDNRSHIKHSNTVSMFSIGRVKPSDSGIYTVVSKTLFGITSSWAAIQVVEVDTAILMEFTPFFEEGPIDTVVNTGEDLRLYAKIKTTFSCQITWFKDEEVLENDVIYQIRDYGDYYYTLTIPNPTGDDSGVYKIELLDPRSGKQVAKSCCVTVSGDELPYPVNVLKPVQSMISLYGAKPSFDCVFEVTDLDNYYACWHIGRYRVLQSSSVFRVAQKDGTFVLKILNTSSGMMGEVMCELHQRQPDGTVMVVGKTTSYLTIVPGNTLKVWSYTPLENAPSEIISTRFSAWNDEGILSSSKLELVSVHKQCEKTRPDPNLLLMEIEFVRLEKDHFYFLHVEKKCKDGKTVIFQVYKRFQQVLEENRTQKKAFIIQWHYPMNYHPALNMWYRIEFQNPQTYEYQQIGVTSLPEIQLLAPERHKPMIFRIWTTPRVEKSKKCSILIGIKTHNISELKSITDGPETGVVFARPLTDYDKFYSRRVRLIGVGAFGRVHMVTNLKTGRIFAAKKVKIRSPQEKVVALREFNILRDLHHPGIVTLYDFFLGINEAIFIFEHLWGKELLDRMLGFSHMEEQEVVIYVRQMCEALEYLHRHNVAHFDLKPENIMCVDENTNLIKIIDFGLSRALRPKLEIRVAHGTKDYVAPEVFDLDVLTVQCDMWSLGIIAYNLLSGLLPFETSNWPAESAKTSRSQFDYNDKAFRDVSDLAKDFIDRLLVVDPNRRMTSHEALKHRWLRRRDTQAVAMKNKSSLKNFLAKSKKKWQMAGFAMIAANRFQQNGKYRHVPIRPGVITARKAMTTQPSVIVQTATNQPMQVETSIDLDIGVVEEIVSTEPEDINFNQNIKSVPRADISDEVFLPETMHRNDNELASHILNHKPDNTPGEIEQSRIKMVSQNNQPNQTALDYETLVPSRINYAGFSGNPGSSTGNESSTINENTGLYNNPQPGPSHGLSDFNQNDSNVPHDYSKTDNSRPGTSYGYSACDHPIIDNPQPGPSHGDSRPDQQYSSVPYDYTRNVSRRTGISYGFSRYDNQYAETAQDFTKSGAPIEPQPGTSDGRSSAWGLSLPRREYLRDRARRIPAREIPPNNYQRDPTNDEHQQWLDSQTRKALKGKQPKYAKSRVKAKSSSRNLSQPGPSNDKVSSIPSESPIPGHSWDPSIPSSSRAQKPGSAWDRSGSTYEFRPGPSRPPMPSLSVTLPISRGNTDNLKRNEGVIKPNIAVVLPLSSSSPSGFVPEQDLQIDRLSAEQKQILLEHYQSKDQVFDSSTFSKNVDSLLLAALQLDNFRAKQALERSLSLPPPPEPPQMSPKPEPRSLTPQPSTSGLQKPVRNRSPTPNTSDSSTPRSQSPSPRRSSPRLGIDSKNSRCPTPQPGTSWGTMSQPLDFRTTITPERNDSRFILPLQADTAFRPESPQDARLYDIRCDSNRSRTPLPEIDFSNNNEPGASILESESKNFRPFRSFAIKCNAEKDAAMACDITRWDFEEDIRRAPTPMADMSLGNSPEYPGSPSTSPKFDISTESMPDSGNNSRDNSPAPSQHDSSTGSPQLQIDWSGSPKPDLKMNISRPASPVPFEKRLETPRADCQGSLPVPELLRPVAL